MTDLLDGGHPLQCPTCFWSTFRVSWTASQCLHFCCENAPQPGNEEEIGKCHPHPLPGRSQFSRAGTVPEARPEVKSRCMN